MIQGPIIMTRAGMLFLFTLACLTARAQTSYPMLSRCQPAALQRGQTVDVTIAGTQDFAGATGLLFDGAGLTAEVSVEPAKAPASGAKPPAVTSLKAKITVANDAAMGPREFRVVTPQGVSSTGVLMVVAETVVVEADDKANDTLENATMVTLPAALAGTIGKVEDVDWYAFDVEAGQTIALSVWANRLENVIHDLQTHFDPILQLHDARGRELAADDNRDYADPLLIHRFEQAGTYYLQVRDTTYAGNANWSYVLLATPGPYAMTTFPIAVKAGETAELTVIGTNLDPGEVVRLEVPRDAKPGVGLFPLPTARGVTPPAPLVVTTLPIGRETDDAPEALANAPALAMPIAMNGRFGQPLDIDAYTFDAKKGAAYRFEVVARRAMSQADPVLRIVDAQGKTLVEVDDTLGKDPRLEWTAPSDGAFGAVVLDLHGRGGDVFPYVLLAEPARPDFQLTCDPDKLNLGPGARTPVFVKVERRGGFQGAVSVEFEGLPPGLSASPLTIDAKMTQGVIVVTAGPEAAPGGALVTLIGKAESAEDGPLARRVAPRQEIYLPGGGRGLFDVATLAVGVTAPSDITLEAASDEITLTPRGTATIDVTVKRREGFEKPVNLAVDLAHLGQVFASALPPGVSVKAAGSKTLLGPSETAGKIILEAKADAVPCGPVPITVMGHVSINFVVKTAYCTRPIQLTVAPKP